MAAMKVQAQNDKDDDVLIDLNISVIVLKR